MDPKPKVETCGFPGCDKPRGNGYSCACWTHAMMSLTYNGFKPTKRDIREWCGTKQRKT